jgi:hypothetical protein
MGHGKMGWSMHKFASADRDGDGSLNAVEFNEYKYVISIHILIFFSYIYNFFFNVNMLSSQLLAS